MKTDYTLYILMRTDLPSMTTGRAMAQASHASNAFIHMWGKHKLAKQWQQQTSQGFGTAIVLSADLKLIQSKLNLANTSFKDVVIDPEYVIQVSSEIIPYLNLKHRGMFESVGDGKKYLFSRSEVTCAYIFGSKEELKPILGDLPLHP